jgi:hypothetical protein
MFPVAVYAHNFYTVRMKVRKNLLLDERAVARGEKAARDRNLSLSGLIEEHLLSIPNPEEEEEFWPGPAGKPLKKAGAPRYEYLRRKHS